MNLHKFNNNTVSLADLITQMEHVTEYYKNVTNSTTKNAGVKAQFLLYDYLIPAIGTFIILTNFAVVISSGLILKKGQQPRSTYLFLGNVAMTDLVTGVAVVFGQLYPKENRTHNVCAIQIGMIVSPTLASVFSVGLIAVDRFLYILYGMQYQRWVYPNRARLLIGITWIIGLIIGFLPLMGWSGNTKSGRWCWFIRLAPRGVILLTVIAGIIPLLVVLCLYSVILYHALQKIRQLRNSDANRSNLNPSGSDESGTKNLRMFRGGNHSDTSDAEESSQDDGKKGILRLFKKKPSNTVKAPNKWKAIKVVLFTTGSFVITWVPYFLTSLIYSYQCDADIKNKQCDTMRLLIASPLAILGFMNSLINPIIYAWWHKGFRQFVKKKISSFKMGNNTVSPGTSETHSKNVSKKTSSSVSSEKRKGADFVRSPDVSHGSNENSSSEHL